MELLALALRLDGDVRAQFVAAARAGPGIQRERDAEVENDRPRTYANSLPALAPLNMLTAPTATPLIDRVDELAIIHQLLAVEGARLLTLTGPAGVGKTRLALAAAAQISTDRDHFPDGVTFADLAPVRDARQVVSSLAAAIGLLDTGNRSWLERLVEALDGRRLMVLDNFEQVLPAAAQLADLLTACPGLTLLVTSRAPLQLRWERTLRVAPLPVPDLSVILPSLDALLTVPSVELFVGRARAHRADFAFTERHAPLVARVAAQLDGLPLALELAAARLDVLPLHTLARRLDERLRLLTSEGPDTPQRHQSLEAAVGWSYDLLNEEERRLFRCLGVFVGRVSLDAITAVARAVEAGTGARGNVNDGETGRATESNRTLHALLSLASKSLLLPMDAESKWPD
ncbi:MAG TPA: AAA family ATPase, partial [Ktedonobacterales bacterium]|nr:AAA family ATPase [Ktedonobacterales bacterium]